MIMPTKGGLMYKMEVCADDEIYELMKKLRRYYQMDKAHEFNMFGLSIEKIKEFLEKEK